MPGETFAFSSGTQVDNGIALPAGAVVPPVTLVMRFAGNSASVAPAARTLFTPEGSLSYQVVAVTGVFNAVGSQSYYLVNASGTTPVGSGAPIMGSGLNTYGTANTQVYGVLTNSTALLTIPPGNTLGLRGTASATEPEGVMEIVLQRLG